MARQRRKARGEAPSTEAESAGAAAHGKSALRENFESIIVAVLFALFVRTFVAQPYKIPSGSMEENLLIGDHVVVDKILHAGGSAPDGPSWLPVRKIRRGDVVIFRPPHQSHADYIKRVIGLPGDELVLTHDPSRNGVRVAVNGERLPESYRTSVAGPVTAETDAGWTVNCTGVPPEQRRGWFETKLRLGPDQYFMMGDNRNDSEDSRFWGPVDAERIRGRALFIYWSYEVTEDEPKSAAGFIAYYARIALNFFGQSRWERTFQGLE